MKQFISNIKNLSQKAAEIKAAMQQVPPKVAEIREAVASTAGQLQQLRMDVQSTVSDLKADNEHRLSQAVQEINGSLDVFLEAGFELGGMDLEISPVQRLLVHLYKLEEVHPSRLRSLISDNQHRKTTSAILTSMLQAHEMAETVELSPLTYNELIVSIGPIPSVRICWRTEQTEHPEGGAKPDKADPVAAPVVQATQPEPSQSFFGQGSFFERRTPQPQSTPVPATPLPATLSVAQPIRVSLATKESPVAEARDDMPDPLARFKKMPDLSRLKR